MKRLALAVIVIVIAAPLFAGKPGRGGRGQEVVTASTNSPTALMRRADDDKPAIKDDLELTRRGAYAKWRVAQFGGNPSGKHRIRPGDAPTIMRNAASRGSAPQSFIPLIGKPLAATLGGSFAGIGDTGFFPPDPAMAAGPYNLVAATNGSVSIFKKNGTFLNSMSLKAFVGATDFTFDPKVMFDPYINRFWVIAVSKNTGPDRTAINVALSDTDDATGTWKTFPLNMKVNGSEDDNNWCDYPQMGMDANHVYFTCNMFDFGDNDSEFAKIRILTKSQFVNNSCCTWWDFWDMSDGIFSSSFTIQPARMYGAGPDTPMILVNAHGAGDDDDTLSLWKITNADKCCDGSSGPTLDGEDKGVGEFTVPHNGRQMNESIRIDSGDTRLLYAIWKLDRLAMGQSSGCDDDNDVCVAYTELDLLHGIGSATVVNDWVFGDATRDSFYPQGAVNAADNKAIVYTRTSPSEFAGARVLGVPSSNICTNCVESADQTLLDGANTYVRKDDKDRNRWGDYFGAAPDPDGVGVWIHAQAAGATFDTWQTQIGLTYEALDTTPPTTTMTIVPAPVNGWNRYPAFVHITSTDTQSGPRIIYYGSIGAEPINFGPHLTGDTFVALHNEGTTQLGSRSEDNWGNFDGLQNIFINLDNTPPVTQCAPPDGVWHADNVTINCIASDALSGVVGATQNFEPTTVPAGVETANALTTPHAFCDQPGNCTTAGPIGGNKIDRKAPSIAISIPSLGPSYVINQVVASSFTCADGGSGVATCDGPANVDTASTGLKTFSVNATDAVLNASAASEPYSVTYNVCAKYDAAKPRNAGSQYVFQVDLCDANGAALSNAAVVLTATAIVPSAPLDPGGVLFAFTNGGYKYGLSTKGYAPGNYKLMVSVSGDPQQHALPFILK